MKKKICILIAFVAISICCYAQTKVYSEYEKNVLAFNAQGIKLGDSYSAFKEKFPNAIYMVNGSDDTQKVYCVESIPNVTMALFYFFDNTLYEIRYGYDVKQGNKLGGWVAIAENFIKKYGRFSFTDSKTSQDIIFDGYTNYYAIDRYVEFRVTEELVTLIFEDTDLAEKMREKKMNSMDYGF